MAVRSMHNLAQVTFIVLTTHPGGEFYLKGKGSWTNKLHLRITKSMSTAR